MAANKVRGDYEQLNQIAQAFSQETDAVRQMLQNIQEAKNVLENGHWVGKGADKFYQEMNSAVLPALNRLANALDTASKTTRKISRIIKQAEDDSAALFRIAGEGGSSRFGFGPGMVGGGGTGGAGAFVGAGRARSVDDLKAEIRKAIGGWGTDETRLYALMISATQAELDAIWNDKKFMAEIRNDLTTDEYAFARAYLGKSLTVKGDTQGFADMANAVIGAQYKVVVGSDGVVSLQQTDVQGPLSPEAQELVNALQTAMHGLKPTTLEFVHNDATVIGGQYTTGKIDLDDIQQFGNGPGLSTGGALVHEVTEQYRKQVFGEDFPTAHAAALAAEARAVGAPRGTESLKTINASTVELTLPYTYPDGTVVNVVATITNNSITKVTR